MELENREGQQLSWDDVKNLPAAKDALIVYEQAGDLIHAYFENTTDDLKHVREAETKLLEARYILAMAGIEVVPTQDEFLYSSIQSTIEYYKLREDIHKGLGAMELNEKHISPLFQEANLLAQKGNLFLATAMINRAIELASRFNVKLDRYNLSIKQRVDDLIEKDKKVDIDFKQVTNREAIGLYKGVRKEIENGNKKEAENLLLEARWFLQELGIDLPSDDQELQNLINKM